MTRSLPNSNISMPDEYVAMMRHCMPKLPIQAIRDAWTHNATPLEVMRHLERVAPAAIHKHLGEA